MLHIRQNYNFFCACFGIWRNLSWSFSRDLYVFIFRGHSSFGPQIIHDIRYCTSWVAKQNCHISSAMCSSLRSFTAGINICSSVLVSGVHSKAYKVNMLHKHKCMIVTHMLRQYIKRELKFVYSKNELSLLDQI